MPSNAQCGPGFDRAVHMMNIEQLHRLIADHDIRLIRAMYVGPDGISRGKAVTPSGVDSMLASGLGLTQAQASVTVFDVLPPTSHYQPIGEVRLVPDPQTFQIMPYLPGHARLLADLYTLGGQPWELCPRSLLRRVVGSLTERGFTIRAAFENEFTLYAQPGDRWVPFADYNCFGSAGIDQASPFALAAIEALEAQDVHVEKFFTEAGPGQLEIPVRHQPGMRAADQQVVFRETVRGVALAQGYRLSFMPKAYPDSAGNGCHIHLSLWDQDSRNVFYAQAQEYELSSIGRQFVAGILAHTDGLLAFTAPTCNSYKRFVERSWSSCYTGWGPDNREATVRVVSSFAHDREATLNLEYRPADPTCNPYLALSALIIAGLDGIDRELDPGPATLTDPALLSPDERKKHGLLPYPTDLSAALAALERDELLCAEMGAARVRDYLTMKRAEIDAIAALGRDGERLAYQFRF
ncbi:MAG: glutamine synthetase family protein [Proteobacteria bacterium]|nr:glutamine synthetase family protein [Pseudomonadota bacterium]